MEGQTTPLHDWHVDQGANMALFGGYHMPLWYPVGTRQEHLAVLTAAGLFDTSHMALVAVAGAGARDLLQTAFTKDLSRCIGRPAAPLKDNRCVYGAFLNPSGHVLDDAIVYQTAAERYLVVVNAAMGPVIAAHLADQAPAFDRVDITDLTGRVAKIDLQGPASARILLPLLADGASALSGLPYFGFKGHFDDGAPQSDTVRLADGAPVLLSRTGYTGEFGFEIFVAPDRVMGLWKDLLATGRPMGLVPCGLAARDSLRAGATLPLSHQDIGPWPFVYHPWTFALPYDGTGSGFTKDFIGAEALARAGDAPCTRPFVGYDLRKVSVQDPAVVLDDGDRPLGTVLTCATDMGIGRIGDGIVSVASPDRPADFSPRGLCCGFVQTKTALASGRVVRLKDGHRTIRVEIVDDIRPHRTARRPMDEMLHQGGRP